MLETIVMTLLSCMYGGLDCSIAVSPTADEVTVQVCDSSLGGKEGPLSKFISLNGDFTLTIQKVNCEIT